MTQISTDDRPAKIQEAVDQYIDLKSRGGDVSIDDFAAQFTDLLPDLEVELEKLERVRGAWQQAQRPPSASAATLSLEVPEEESLTITGLRIRCAYCRTPVDIHDDTSLCHIKCGRCGGAFSIVEADERFQSGSMLGDFRLVEELGSGGFGTVWKADDTELERSVAVKIPRRGQIEPQEVEQFLREARTAAQLQHPGIVSVHEVGREEDTVYIVSELVEGTTLGKWQPKGRPVQPRRAAEMCRRIATALHYAHGRGVVHRDLKPQNIMVDAAGEPHLMDFGLARRASGETTVTKDGNVLGTPAYMSPEQARGESHDVDARTDLYSLGVVLFQLLTGRLPFRGDTSKLLYQVIHDEPPRPRSLHSSVPRDLETICLKCLEKDPDRRYASAEEVARDLDCYVSGQPIKARPISRIERTWRWCKRNPGQAALATAVLVLVAALGVVGFWPSSLTEPFESIAIVLRSAENDESPYLRDELSRTLQRRLDDFENLTALPRSRVLKYEDNREIGAEELARELGVDGVLVGEVDEDGNNVRLQLRLVAQHDGKSLWQDDYDGPANRLPGVKHAIVKAIVRGVALELTVTERSALDVNPEIARDAYQAYLNGKRQFYRFTEQSLEDAAQEFTEAISAEPGFAEAYAGLAEVYFGLAYMFQQPDGNYVKAKRFVKKALDIDGSLTDAIVIQGGLDYFCDWKWKEAQDALELALEIDPTLVDRNACYLHLLDAMGRPNDAVELVESALNRQPESRLLRGEYACSLYYAHDFERSREVLDDLMRPPESPTYFDLWQRARANAQLGDYNEAIKDCNIAIGKQDWSPLYSELGYAHARKGDEQGAEIQLGRLEEKDLVGWVDPYEFAMVYAGLAEAADESSDTYREYVRLVLEKLRLAIELRSPWLPSLNTDPKFHFLRVREHREFQDLLDEIGFEKWTPST